jgi:hypothetical protein
MTCTSLNPTTLLSMTVCVAVCVDDGLVFAADSASTLQTDAGGRSIVANVYKYGNKVFNLVRGLPLAAMTAGMGSIGRAPIQSLAKDLRSKLASDAGGYQIDRTNFTIEQIAISARKFLYEDRYQRLDPPPPPPHSLHFWVGGYSSREERPELWKVVIVNGTCEAPHCLRQAGDCGIDWGGQPEAIHRLLMGFAQSMAEVLKTAGVAEADLPKLMNLIRQSTQAPLVAPQMPIQDAIELADFLVDVTKKYIRFLPGADVVGGDSDIAAVTRHEHFKWISRKHYYPPHLNPLEIDHV